MLWEGYGTMNDRGEVLHEDPCDRKQQRRRARGYRYRRDPRVHDTANDAEVERADAACEANADHGPDQGMGRGNGETEAACEQDGGCGAREHVRRVREAWTNRAEYRAAKTRVTRLERQIKRLDTELDRSPGRAQLEHRLARQLRELQPPQRRTLLRSLPIPHRKLLAAATMIGREFAREQGHER